MDQNNRQPTTLLLIRHGETDANAGGALEGATDSPLNARGREQAAALAQRLVGGATPIDALYCSPLLRARETAGALALALDGVPLQVEPDLAEFHMGEWEGLSYTELAEEKQLWQRMLADPHFGPPGGESAFQFGTRVLQTLERIIVGHPGQIVAVVSHGGAIATALSLFLDGKGGGWTRYVTDNCAVSEIAFEPQPRLVRFNETNR